MRHPSLFLFIAGLILLFSQCKKVTPAEILPQGRLADPLVFDYGYFNTGSYWIYRDSVTGTEDSIYVTQALKGMDTLSSGTVYEGFSNKVYSTFENREFTIHYHSIHSSDGRDKIFHSIFENDTNRQVVLFEIPVTAGNVLNYQNTTLTTLNFHDTLIQDLDTFFNVIHTYQSNDKTHYEQPAEYFISKNTGIIRKKYLGSGEVWNLVRFNVVQ